jgi:hypothetical protein
MNGVWCEAFTVENCKGKTCRLIGGNDIKVEYMANIIVFYAAGLVLLNVQISESHNSRQCGEWLL